MPRKSKERVRLEEQLKELEKEVEELKIQNGLINDKILLKKQTIEMIKEVLS